MHFGFRQQRVPSIAGSPDHVLPFSSFSLFFFCGDGGGGKKGRRERLGERARVMHNFGLTVMVSRVLANDRDARIAVEFVGRNSTR